MYHQLLITYIDVRPTRSIRRLIFFAWNDMINFQSLDLCKQLFSNNRREARSAIIFLRYRFDWVKLLKNLVVFSNFLQSLTNGKQKCLDGYIYILFRLNEWKKIMQFSVLLAFRSRVSRKIMIPTLNYALKMEIGVDTREKVISVQRN